MGIGNDPPALKRHAAVAMQLLPSVKKGVRGENARCEGHEEELAKGENARCRGSARSMGCIMRRRRGRNHPVVA